MGIAKCWIYFSCICWFQQTLLNFLWVPWEKTWDYKTIWRPNWINWINCSVDCKNMALFLNSQKADVLLTCVFLFFNLQVMRKMHLLLAGRSSWCPQPLCQWWSCGTGPHTAAGSALHVSPAAVAVQDSHWWSSHRIVWGFQKALAAGRNRHLKSINKIKTIILFLFHLQTITLCIVLSPQKQIWLQNNSIFLWTRKLQLQTIG